MITSRHAPKRLVWAVFLSSILIMSITTRAQYEQQEQCVLQKLPAPAASRSTVYEVGVLAFRGEETAFKEFNQTFAEYLTLTVGDKFDPPIRFNMVPLSFGGEESILDQAVSGRFDFLFLQPSMSSCVDSEVGAHPIVTFIPRRQVQGEVYELSQFGGVIFTRNDNTDIQTIQDLKGKRASCTAISGLGSGQMQFREMQKAGLHHIQDLKQLVFMEKQGRVVDSVIFGEVDAGFVRTDQLERSTDPITGEPLDLSKVKIISKQENVLQDNGEIFPFPVSTPLYPEWNLVSLSHVDSNVVKQVQQSLLSMADHASIAPALSVCYEANGCLDTESGADNESCRANCFQTIDSKLFRCCDTSPELALLAHDAMNMGKYAGWKPPLSNMELRNMQEETGFIETPGLNQVDKVQCVRATKLADAVICPPGHFKRPEQDILNGCESEGIPCYGFQCLCSPCVKAYGVDFFPVDPSGVSFTNKNDEDDVGTTRGCSKFSVCGTVAQADKITFQAIDNRKRLNATFTARVLVTEDGEDYSMEPTSDATSSDETLSHEFTFDATGRTVGVVIVQVFINGEQIPQSPFRLKVSSRDCETATGDSLRRPDAFGECVCESGTISMDGKCRRLSVILPSIILPGLFIVFALVRLYVRHKRRQADSIWKVKPEELKFPDTPHVLGQGTFGQILLAEYRGTQVAVKRALPPRKRREKSSSTNCWHLGDFDSPEAAPSARTSGDSLDNLEMGIPNDFGARSSFPVACLSIGNRMKLSSLGVVKPRGWRSRQPSTQNSSRTSFQLQQDFIHEMRLLSTLRHPCITSIMGAVLAPGVEPMLVMEHMELGSLYDLLHNDCMILEGETLLPMLQDIAQGMRFLHSANPKIVHGDLKAHNILVDSRFRAKVADFGLSQKRRHANKSATGTPFWMAPELLRNESTNTTASDVYAFGMVLYETFSRKDPYEGEENHLEVLRQIADDVVRKRPPVPTGCPDEITELMNACLRAKPQDRPTSQDIDMRLRLLDADKLDNNNYNEKPKRSSPSSYTEDLLSHIFPPHIAEALQHGRKPEPENHPCVTVYFSDIVNYTEIAGSLPPAKVSDLLDRLYTQFDNLCGIHDVFKVETVGDAYMTVTNLATSQADSHVRVMTQFAFDAVQIASETLIDVDDPSKGTVQIRVGFHSGPVVSHVVGSRNPRYSIIGDTVNTASRMESNSLPGRIHCSLYSAKLLHEQCPEVQLKSRGKRSIKGKGEMVTFWVDHKATPSTITRSSSMTMESSTASGSSTTTTTTTVEDTDNAKHKTDVPESPPNKDRMTGSTRHETLAGLYDYLQPNNRSNQEASDGLGDNSRE